MAMKHLAMYTNPQDSTFFQSILQSFSPLQNNHSGQYFENFGLQSQIKQEILFSEREGDEYYHQLVNFGQLVQDISFFEENGQGEDILVEDQKVAACRLKQESKANDFVNRRKHVASFKNNPKDLLRGNHHLQMKSEELDQEETHRKEKFTKMHDIWLIKFFQYQRYSLVAVYIQLFFMQFQFYY